LQPTSVSGGGAWDLALGDTLSEAIKRAMNCPTCNANMPWGRLRIVSHGAASLYFEPPGADLVLVEQETGFRCETCGTVVICQSTANDTEAPCLACGAVMAPGVTVCPQCGWTYEAGRKYPSV
jgi:predicted RNA-binding Zn-ribbon protein involved in translation (DUF1610 family)